jgi:hypothetical protein
MDKLFETLGDSKCMTGVIPECEGLTISYNKTGFQLLTSELVSSANFILTTMIQTGAANFNWNQLRAMNAARCAIFNLGENAWTWLAGTYYLIKQFGD